MVDIQSTAAEIRRGIKKKKKIEITGQKYNYAIPIGTVTVILFVLSVCL